MDSVLLYGGRFAVAVPMTFWFGSVAVIAHAIGWGDGLTMATVVKKVLVSSFARTANHRK